MKSSVIIPTYNEEKDIRECLESLEKQTYKNFEVIVVDDGSTDKTLEVIQNEIKRKRLKISLFKQKHQGPGAARNLGSKNAKGEILVFVDADMTFDKEYLKNLIKPILENSEIIGTSHSYESVNNTDNIWSKCWGKIRLNEKEGYGDSVIFRAILKNKFFEMGGFNPKYGYADDQTFFIEKKIRPYVAKDTLCYHKNPESLKQVYKQSRWIGASLKNKLLDVPILRLIIPFLMILVFPIAIVLISIKKIIENREPKIFFQMLIFITARYFGTIEGIFRKIYLNKNIR